MEKMNTPHGSVPLYVAVPDGAGPNGGGPWPGVVLVHDAFGMTENLHRHAAWLASAGFLTIAPSLYARGNPLVCARAAFRAVAERKGAAFDDIEAARAALVARADCTGKVGVIGFCMGGGFALVAAVDHGFDVSSVNYGTVPGDAVQFLSGACPIVASFGGKDPGFKGAAGLLDRALGENGIAHDVVEYPAVSHAFIDEYHGWGGWLFARFGFSHHPVEAADAKARIVAFFSDKLG